MHCVQDRNTFLDLLYMNGGCRIDQVAMHVSQANSIQYHHHKGEVHY